MNDTWHTSAKLLCLSLKRRAETRGAYDHDVIDVIDVSMLAFCQNTKDRVYREAWCVIGL